MPLHLYPQLYESTPTITPKSDCVSGAVNIIPKYIKIPSAITCALSVIGVVVIVFTYVAYKRFRSKMREIIVHVSLMDFTVAMANLIGILVGFESRLYPYEPPWAHPSQLNHSTVLHYHTLNNLCIAQAAFAVYGTLGSVLWLTALTVYCYFVIVGEDMKRARKISYSFYIICYGIPIIITLWLAVTGKIGYSPVGSGGGWCSYIVDELNFQEHFTIFMGNNLWMYMTFIVIFFVTLSILIHLKTQLKLDFLSHREKAKVQTIEKKLLAIPILFLVLRIWSFVFTLIILYIKLESCTVVLLFLGMASIGNSGQGFFNAIIFCFFNKHIRQSYAESIRNCFRSETEQSDHLNNAIKGINHDSAINHDSTDCGTVLALDIESETEDPNDSESYELAKPGTRKWKEQSASFKTANNNSNDN